MGHRGVVSAVVMMLTTAGRADPPGATPPHPPQQAAQVPARPPASSPVIEVVDPSPHARTEALIATGITGALLGGEIFTLVRMSQAQDHVNYLVNASTSKAELAAATDANDRWHQRAYAVCGLLVVSVAVTGVLWTRTETTYRVAVTPTGAYVGYARSF
jgi:hypothetical protein